MSFDCIERYINRRYRRLLTPKETCLFEMFATVLSLVLATLSLCHARSGERVQGQLFAHALNKPITGDMLRAMTGAKF